MTADLGREAVYAAEITAFEGTSYELIAPFDELLATATVVTSAAWWPHGPIEIVPARSDARSSSTRQRGPRRPTVRLASPQMTAATLVHELAHVLAGVAHGHDGVFRRAHVDLVGVAFGDDAAEWMLDGYAVMDLTPGIREWAAPPLRRFTGPVAL